MSKIRLGILGPGRITARVMADMHNAQDIEVTAIASRSLERAEAAAKTYGIPVALGSYEAMAACDRVDLVYIATPNPFHEEQACMMMAHGKHVLCEKPAALNDAQVQRMVDCAKTHGVFFMEAMWTRFMPAWQAMKKQLGEGVIGSIRHVTSNFSYRDGNPDPDSRAYNMSLGAGALLDLGVYPLMGITDLLGWEPLKVHGDCCLFATGADMRTSAQMVYGDGATAQFFCGMDAPSSNDMWIYGESGWIHMPEAWHPTSFTLKKNGQDPVTYTVPAEHEGHHYEFDHAAHCIRQGMTESPAVTWAESVAVSRICTEIRRQNGIVFQQEKDARQ